VLSRKRNEVLATSRAIIPNFPEGGLSYRWSIQTPNHPVGFRWRTTSNPYRSSGKWKAWTDHC